MDNLNEKEDRYWTVEEIIPHIINYLKKKFPDSIIMREFGQIDVMVLGPNIPVEIQRTYLIGGSVRMADFEDRTQRQIRTNIENCGVCWFFFDAKFLDHLQNRLHHNTSIDMNWFYQFWKDGKLKVFAVLAGEDPRELNDRDFDFMKKNNEDITLERNRYAIAYKVLRRYGITTDMTISWYNEYKQDSDVKDSQFSRWLHRKGGKKRDLSYILRAIGNMRATNDMLKCNARPDTIITIAPILGIIKGNGYNGNDRHARITCSDQDNILEYFPGYFINKELWDYWKINSVPYNIFVKVVKGEYPNYLIDRKNQKSIDEVWR